MESLRVVARPAGGAAPRDTFALALVGLVLALYAWIGSGDLWQMGAAQPEDAYYNRLVAGLRKGQLHLDVPVPPGLTALENPYDPVANRAYRVKLHDTSYYQGRIYLYFGITPALLLFLPYSLATGAALSHAQATLIFCALGYVAGVALFLSIRRQCFPGVGAPVVALGVLTLGLANAVPVMLRRADIWEVPISCAFLLVTLALGAIWNALRWPARRGRWLALASLAFGLALGARPSVLFGGFVLLVPVVLAWREGGEGRVREGLRLLLAAVAPVVLIGLGLLAYNHARFGRWSEFGQKYQLAGVDVSQQKLMSPSYVAYNARAYLLQMRTWSGEFPYQQGIRSAPPPPGHLGVEGAFGALVDAPILWLAFAVPLLGWRRWRPDGDRALAYFAVAAAGLVGACLGVLCLFAGVCARYQVEFMPTFALLAAIGLLVIAQEPAWTRVARMTAAILLAVTATTLWLTSYKTGAEARREAGDTFALRGETAAAIREYERALALQPDDAYAHQGLALALSSTGRVPEAIEHFRAAIRRMPDYAEAHNCLGVALLKQRQPAEALQAFEQALVHQPAMAEALYGSSVALVQLQRIPEAVGRLETALRLKPDFAPARQLLEAVQRPPAR